MPTVPHHLAHAALPDIRDVRYDLAVLPWGATEAHNQHLPYGTDNVQVETIALESARRANSGGARCIVLPTIPFGVNTTQLDIPLTINMNPSTQARLLDDVVTSLEHQGVPRLVILNGHGGNDFKPMVRELVPRHQTFLCVADWYRCVPRQGYVTAPGDHADEMETAVMLAVAPDLVRPLSTAGSGAERKLRPAAFREGWAWTPRDWKRASEDTGIGDPRGATPEAGHRYVEAVIAALASFLTELASTPLDALYEGERSRDSR